MTSPISGSTAAATTKPSAEVNRSDQMGKDTFLKLLVAQMRFQDPSNPTSSSEFMAQTATFTQVEKLEQLATQNAALVTMQRALSAGAMVGHTVSYTDTDGTTRSGTVSAVRLAGGDSEPVAVVGGVPVPMGRLTEVSLPTG
ncbi:MAG: flagellar hook capping protein [Modestobacter sp.]|jgi:flagellar basal-body rod modification protein FlgD|nr:flagellar hook capping protein [Modestobacter sp.]